MDKERTEQISGTLQPAMELPKKRKWIHIILQDVASVSLQATW
jgi:hypothetical protein